MGQPRHIRQSLRGPSELPPGPYPLLTDDSITLWEQYVDEFIGSPTVLADAMADLEVAKYVAQAVSICTAADAEFGIEVAGLVQTATDNFQQYLTTTQIPVLQYHLDGRKLSYRWTHAVPGFDMPVRVLLSDGASKLLKPTGEWRTVKVKLDQPADFKVDPNFYVTAAEVAAVPD